MLRYYTIRLQDREKGWPYKGNFKKVDGSFAGAAASLSKDSLPARSDVLKIIVIDVEVGNSTLIICPEEDGIRGVLLIDIGEDDSDRIKQLITDNGFDLATKLITRFKQLYRERLDCCSLNI